LPDCIKICNMGRVWNIEGTSLNGIRTRVEFSLSKTLIFILHNDGKHIPILIQPENACAFNHTILIKGAGRVKTVEHLFSALYGLNIFNIRIDLFGNEVPFFDGSSREFVRLLFDYPITNDFEQISLDKEILVQDKNSYLLYEPARGKLTIDMVLEHPFIGKQEFAIEINRENYIHEIAPARTFVFTDLSDPRLKELPPYGFGITAERVYSFEPLRFPDEAVRHKILDLLGELYLLRKKLVGRIRAYNTSHLLNLKFIREILRNWRG